MPLAWEQAKAAQQHKAVAPPPRTQARMMLFAASAALPCLPLCKPYTRSAQEQAKADTATAMQSNGIGHAWSIRVNASKEGIAIPMPTRTEITRNSVLAGFILSHLVC
jgi:hypothetical protein